MLDTIYSAKPSIISIIGYQKINKNGIYRINKFCLTVNQNSKILIYNTLTNVLIRSKEKEINSKATPYFEKLDDLISNWFLVPMNFDEDKLYSQLEMVIKAIPNNPRFINHYTILPTTQCNANCGYCFENGKSRISMNSSLAIDCADFICKHANPDKPVHFNWFGGEPLCNTSAIDTICKAAKESKLAFTSSMVSNCSLCSDKLIENMVNNWNLKKVKVTIDGTEKEYNKIKAYNNLCSNPYDLVLENIKSLISNGIQVICRVHFNSKNKNDSYNLINDLLYKFEANQFFKIQPHMVYSYSSDKRLPISEKDTFEFIEFQNYIYEKRALYIGAHKLILQNHHCIADRDDSVVIFPDGKLGKCEYYIDSHAFSDIYESFYSIDNIRRYKAVSASAECKSCYLRTVCYRIKNCPNNIYEYCDNKELLKKKMEYWMIESDKSK